MLKMERSTITWSLSLATIVAVGVWIGLFIYRVREQQQAIAALHEIEVIDFMCVLPAEGVTSLPAGVGISRSKLTSPVEFEPHGPEWLRSRIGEDRCRNWIDTPIAVNLYRSETCDVDLPQLACFPKLKKLDLTGTKVTAAGLVVLRRLPELEELRFGSDDLTDASLDHLERLTQLHILSVLWGSISDAGLKKVSRLPKLRELCVASRAVTDEGFKVLARMEKLETLSLSSGAITESGVRELSRLPRLKYLYLGEIRDISAECLDGLREERPWLRIVYEPYGPPP